MNKNEKLKEGVELSVISTDKFKSAMFMITYIMPLTPENAACASLLSSVLRRGCNKYPDMRKINIKREELYSSALTTLVQKRGEMLFFSVYCSFLEARYLPNKEDLFAELLKLTTDIVFDPLVNEAAFDEAYVASEKANLITAIQEKLNNKASYAFERCVSIMCENEPFAVPATGEIPIINDVDGKKLYSFYIDMLSQAPIRMTYVGQADIASVKDYINKYLPELHARTTKLSITDASDPKKEYKQVVEKVKASQGKLSIGMRTGISAADGDALAFVLFNEVYGGSPSAKLFAVIREKMSLCYYCSSGGDPYKGILVVSSGIENENFEKTTQGILDQLEEIKKGNISDNEMLAAKKSIVNYYNSVYDSPYELAMWYLYKAAHGICYSPDEASQAIARLEKSDIIRVAKKIRPQVVYFLEGEGEENE